MTLKKQLLLLLLIHLFAALAAWDGYRIGYRKGLAEIPKIRTTPTYDDAFKNRGYDFYVCSNGHETWYSATLDCKHVISDPYKSQRGRERWDANWRLN